MSRHRHNYVRPMLAVRCNCAPGAWPARFNSQGLKAPLLTKYGDKWVPLQVSPKWSRLLDKYPYWYFKCQRILKLEISRTNWRPTYTSMALACPRVKTRGGRCLSRKGGCSEEAQPCLSGNRSTADKTAKEWSLKVKNRGYVRKGGGDNVGQRTQAQSRD